MRAQGYALFFLLLFATFLAAPSIIKLVKACTNTSYFFNIAEEEKKENNTEEKESHFIVASSTKNNSMLSKLAENSSHFAYTATIYPLIILDDNCPPPEFS